MKGKKTEAAEWIKTYLREQGAEASSWEEYKVLYNRYAIRIRKYHPENYQQFVTTCTFAKQTKKSCGARDLGESKPKEPKPFNEKKFWKDEKKDFEAWKLRCQRYQEGKITNWDQQGETGRLKDRPPYMFLFAMRCLSGTYPLEAFPEELESYRKELQDILNSTNY